MIDITNILGGAILVLLGLAGAFLIPWLKNNLGDQKFERLAYWVDVFVRAAEQMLQDVPGEEKRAWVEEQLAKMGFKANIDELRALIEAAVLNL